MSLIFTFPFAIRILSNLSYSNVSALMINPSVDFITPFFVPINLFPFSVISTSVTSKLKGSLALIEEPIKV